MAGIWAYFGLGATLYLACIGLEGSLFRGSPIADWLAFAAGVFALTILNFQHEILHIHGDGLDGAAEDAWLNLTCLVTGMNAQQWQTQYSHHAFTSKEGIETLYRQLEEKGDVPIIHHAD